MTLSEPAALPEPQCPCLLDGGPYVFLVRLYQLEGVTLGPEQVLHAGELLPSAPAVMGVAVPPFLVSLSFVKWRSDRSLQGGGAGALPKAPGVGPHVSCQSLSWWEFPSHLLARGIS